MREAKAVENSERLKNRVWWERAGDTLTKIRRAGVLSSIRVIPKLISAGVQRMTTLPLEEAVGSLYRNLPGTRAVAANAPLEGRGMNLGRELRAMRASVAVAKTGSSDLDLELGKPGESYSGERTLGGTVLELPGRSHGAIKAPVKRFGFTRAVEALEEFYAKQEGADGKPLNVQDPMVRARIRVEAYKAANRAIFLQDNFVASKVSNFISERSGNQPVTPYKKAWATAGRVLVPIVKVPTNIVAETFTYAFGLPSAATRLGGRALLKTLGGKMGESIKDLTPEQSDLIMRQLKKGSLGAAALLVGYFNADSVGGYYQPGQKRDSEDVPVGAIRMFGVTVPNWLLHNPLMEVVQFGATVKRVQDSYLRKKDWETQGLGAGVVAAALGLVEEVPFIREMTEVDKLRNPFTRDKFVDQLVSSMIVPGAVSQIAKWTDPADARYPTNLKEWIESGIPVLRQRVPDYK